MLCARPRGSGREDDVPVVTRGDGATTTAYVDVDTWHRLDRLGPHEQFARGCASRAIRDAVAAFAATFRLFGRHFEFLVGAISMGITRSSAMACEGAMGCWRCAPATRIS